MQLYECVVYIAVSEILIGNWQPDILANTFYIFILENFQNGDRAYLNTDTSITEVRTSVLIARIFQLPDIVNIRSIWYGIFEVQSKCLIKVFPACI